MWSIGKPSPDRIAAFLHRHATSAYTYADVGRVADFHPNGFDRDVRREIIGHGPEAFEAARDAFRRWGQFPWPWTQIYPINAPIRAGQSLAMLAHAYGLWWLNACRIVYAIDEPTRFGFAYGTLCEHVECGEEQFLLEQTSGGAVWYDLRAFSRPRPWAVRLAYPLARRQQRQFALESFASMRAAISRSKEAASP